MGVGMDEKPLSCMGTSLPCPLGPIYPTATCPAHVIEVFRALWHPHATRSPCLSLSQTQNLKHKALSQTALLSALRCLFAVFAHSVLARVGQMDVQMDGQMDG